MGSNFLSTQILTIQRGGKKQAERSKQPNFPSKSPHQHQHSEEARETSTEAAQIPEQEWLVSVLPNACLHAEILWLEYIALNNDGWSLEILFLIIQVLWW